jgi:hypothetical protein
LAIVTGRFFTVMGAILTFTLGGAVTGIPLFVLAFC